MSSKSVHLDYIKAKGAFSVDCSFQIFSKEEIDVLQKYGHWFNGLVNGDLKPLTEAQKRFVEVVQEGLTPSNLFEKAWVKYLGRKRLEDENPELFKLSYQYKEEGFHTREDYYKLHPSRRNRK
ncbi:DUF413 domain-containing protein [Tamlana flava]|uniref:DUF413 domain-containing protein n=1 Tax=Tamlana flava TaxID=3158572 RepID=UPI00351BD7DF